LKGDSRILHALSVFHCMNDGSLALFASALPVMRLSVGLSFVQIGTILSLGLVATMLLQLVFGSLSDIGHADRILMLGFAGVVAVDLAFPISSTFTEVLVFYVLLRSAASVYHPVSFASIGRTYVHNKTAAFGFQGAIGDIGLTIATFSTGILSEVLGWRIPFWTWGVIGAGLFAYFARIIMGNRAALQTQLGPPVNRTSATNQGTPGSTRSAFAVLATASSSITVTFILFTGYMPLYFNVMGGLSPSLSTALVAAWICVGVLAGFMTGRVVSKLGGEVRALRVAFAIGTLLFSIAYLAARYESSAPWARTVFYTALVLSGVPIFVAFPTVSGLLGLRMPHRRLGLTYALNLSLGLMVASFVAYLTGYIAYVFSIAIVLPMMLAITTLGMVASFTLRATNPSSW